MLGTVTDASSLSGSQSPRGTISQETTIKEENKDRVLVGLWTQDSFYDPQCPPTPGRGPHSGRL